jgi:hypothetical protein
MQTCWLPHWGHRAMRHFFCNNAIKTGIDFKVIAEWFGPKDGGILVAKPTVIFAPSIQR